MPGLTLHISGNVPLRLSARELDIFLLRKNIKFLSPFCNLLPIKVGLMEYPVHVGTCCWKRWNKNSLSIEFRIPGERDQRPL